MDALAVLVQALGAELAKTVVPAVLASLPKPEPRQPLTLNVDDLAVELRISPSSVRALWRKGTLPSIRVGGMRRTRWADLVAYLDALPTSLPGDADDDEAPDPRSLSLVRGAA